MVKLDLSKITMVPVNSSTLVSLGYDKESSQMVAEFKNGKYMYEGVTEDEYNGILNAASPGKALWGVSNGKPFEKLS